MMTVPAKTALGTALFVAVVVAGCARFESRPLEPEVGAARLEQRTLADPELKTFLENNLRRTFPNWPAPAWDFEMLTFTAFHYQPNLEVARAQWRMTQAETKTAGARPNPTLSVTPEYNFSALSGVTPWAPAISLDVPIETAGKRDKRIARARHLSQAAREKLAGAFWETRSQVRLALIEAVASRRRVELLEKQFTLSQQIVKMLEQRQQAGAIAAAEITSLRVTLAKAALDLSDARRAQAEATARLAEAIGVTLRALADVKIEFALADSPSAAELTSADARRQALLGRADILAAGHGYEAAQAALQLEIARQYPDVHLNPGYQWDQGDNKWHLGLSAELPVFNRNQGPIAEAKAQRAESAAKFEALQAKIIAEIDRAVALLDASRKNQVALDALNAARKTQRESVEAQFQAGALEQLDVLNAQLEFNTTALAELDAQVKLQQSLGALEDAVQRPLEPNTAPPPDVTASSLKK